MSVTVIDFGTVAQRARSELADSLALIAELIRSGEMEHEPHGWVLLLHSDTNPQGFEVLNSKLTGASLLASALNDRLGGTGEQPPQP